MNIHAPPKHKTITATEANRRFSRVLREVAGGTTYTVTSHGREVARIQPPAQPGSGEAVGELLAWARAREPIVVGPWTREELYER